MLLSEPGYQCGLLTTVPESLVDAGVRLPNVHEKKERDLFSSSLERAEKWRDCCLSALWDRSGSQGHPGSNSSGLVSATRPRPCRKVHHQVQTFSAGMLHPRGPSFPFLPFTAVRLTCSGGSLLFISVLMKSLLISTGRKAVGELCFHSFCILSPGLRLPLI